MKSALVMFLGMAMIVLALATGWSMSSRRAAREELPTSHQVPLPVAGEHPVTPFQLIGSDGETYDSSDLEGKIWVASFFFTRCESACITLNNTIADMIAEMPDTDVRFVSITVDPGRDTPEALAKYAENYKVDQHQRWDFLTGKMDDIEAVAEDSFSVSVAAITHSDRMILVGRDGKVVDTYRAGTPSDVARMKKKLAELCETST